MFKKGRKKREFHLQDFSERKYEKSDSEQFEDNKYVSFKKPDRSNYPKIRDFWPFFVIVGMVFLLVYFVMKWLFQI